MENKNKNIEQFEPKKIDIPGIEKKLGDVKISEKKYEDAIHYFKNSIMALKIVFDGEHFNSDDDQATRLIEDVGIPVHLNLAFCYLQLEDWNNVIFYCNKVLELKPDSLKALYRRCKANIKLNNIENANQDIEKLEKLLSSDSEEVKVLKKNVLEIKESKENEREKAYENLAKITNTKNKKTIIKNCEEFIYSLPELIKYYILLIINIVLNLIRLPFYIAIKTTKKVKYVFWDTPLMISKKIFKTAVYKPTKWFINKFNPFSFKFL